MAAGDVIVTAHSIEVISKDIFLGGAWFSTALSFSLNTIRWIIFWIFWWNGRKEHYCLQQWLLCIYMFQWVTTLRLRAPWSCGSRWDSGLFFFYSFFYYLWHFNISPVKARPSPWWDHEGMWQLHALLNNLCENRLSLFFAHKTMTVWKDRK